MLVVIDPDSTKMPDQNQSSGAGFVPPFGRRNWPMCQSAELVEVDLMKNFNSCQSSGDDPRERQRKLTQIQAQLLESAERSQ